jgi:hypothetical protein
LVAYSWSPCSAAARGAVFAGSTCSAAARGAVLVGSAGRIVRRQLPCRAPVVLRVDSFRIAAGLPRAGSFRIVRRSTARRQLPYRAPVYRAPTASVLPPVSCRQVSGWRRPVRARADFYWNLALSTSPTLVAVTVLTVPRAQKIEGQVRPDCSFAPTQRPCCLRFAPVLKGRELATRRNPR